MRPAPEPGRAAPACRLFTGTGPAPPPRTAVPAAAERAVPGARADVAAGPGPFGVCSSPGGGTDPRSGRFVIRLNPRS
ncbi:hypothetical protein GCM10017557_51320 [Streptomyces aurantiacus]|uniref:Uncharacterized protein n=1 Tax=Streptomyces aurantiacus TaxID=47760 RepID=A0A7G1P3D4_9ACTN|nr:hypothetical protein GCM10017557_51320 [Streptomyces aurantiacus]